MKKYEFTGETKIIDGVTLRRIRAVTDFYALRPYNEDPCRFFITRFDWQ